MKRKTTMKKICVLILLAVTGGQVNAQTWTPVTTGISQNLLSIFFLDASNGWIVGGAGGAVKGAILKTANAGATFTSQSTVVFSDNKSIAATDVNNAWIADGTTFIEHTANGGTSWNFQATGSTDPLQHLFFVDAKIGWAVGNNGRIMKTINGGTNWTTQTSGTIANLTKIFCLNANIAWAAGANTTFLKTTNGGTLWQPVNIPLIPVYTNSDISDIFFRDANTGWAALNAGGGPILRTGDGGNTWTTYYATNGSTIFSVWFTDLNTGWAVGTFGGISKSTDSGVTWANFQDVGDAFLNCVFFTDADHGWICGTGGTVWRYANNATVSSPVLGILQSNHSVVISWPASATNFSLYATTNLAPPTSWSAVTNKVQTNLTVASVSLPVTNSSRFFRLQAP